MIIPLLLVSIALVILIRYIQTNTKQTEKHNTMSASVRTCNCKHESQDSLHGKNQRVHNKCGKGHRCTVCGNIKGSSDSSPKK
jgi:hypothetical protein